MSDQQRPPDHKLLIKSVVERDGKTYWLNVGSIALWVDKTHKELTGKVLLNQNPDVRYHVFTDDRGQDKNTTT